MSTETPVLMAQLVQRVTLATRDLRGPLGFKVRRDPPAHEARLADRAPRVNRVPQVPMDLPDHAVLEAPLVSLEMMAKTVKLERMPKTDPKVLGDLRVLLGNAVSPVHKVLQALQVNLEQRVTLDLWALQELWVQL